MLLKLLKCLMIITVMIVIKWIIIQKSLNKIVNLSKLSKPSKPSKPYKSHKKLSIITFNIQKFPWPHKKFNPIINLLKSFDIILLQECFDETFQNLENIFPKHNIYRGKLNHINLMNSGLVILSKFYIEKHDFYIYKSLNSNTNELFCEKGFISIDIKVNNQIIKIINTHMQSSYFAKFDEYALLQFDELMNYINNIKTKFVLGGDFNIDIEDLKKNKDVKYNLYYPKNKTIYVDFKTGHSVAYHVKNYDGLIFDYFISNINNLKTPKTIKNYYSDHLPVALNI